MDMRELFVLGLRVIYAAQHGQVTKEAMLQLAKIIKTENLDNQERVEYTPFAEIGQGYQRP